MALLVAIPSRACAYWTHRGFRKLQVLSGFDRSGRSATSAATARKKPAWRRAGWSWRFCVRDACGD